MHPCLAQVCVTLPLCSCIFACRHGLSTLSSQLITPNAQGEALLGLPLDMTAVWSPKETDLDDGRPDRARPNAPQTSFKVVVEVNSLDSWGGRRLEVGFNLHRLYPTPHLTLRCYHSLLPGLCSDPGADCRRSTRTQGPNVAASHWPHHGRATVWPGHELTRCSRL